MDIVPNPAGPNGWIAARYTRGGRTRSVEHPVHCAGVPSRAGLSRHRRALPSSPVLDHVHGEGSRGQDELKQFRKAREESELLKKSLAQGGGRGKKK